MIHFKLFSKSANLNFNTDYTIFWFGDICYEIIKLLKLIVTEKKPQSILQVLKVFGEAFQEQYVLIPTPTFQILE